MNTYGATARRHWQTFLPDQYSQIPDPETHFARLGEEIADRVAQQTWVIAGDDPADEPYLSKVGRLMEARMSAEQSVLAEFLPDPEHTPAERAIPEHTAIV